MNVSSPRPSRMAIQGMEQVVATCTGYPKHMRAKLIELVNATGAGYTRNFSAAFNTHLVCFRFEGPKYDIAVAKGLKVVNHQWFEDCLAFGTKLPEEAYSKNAGHEIGSPVVPPPLTANDVMDTSEKQQQQRQEASSRQGGLRNTAQGQELSGFDVSAQLLGQFERVGKVEQAGVHASALDLEAVGLDRSLGVDPERNGAELLASDWSKQQAEHGRGMAFDSERKEGGGRYGADKENRKPDSSGSIREAREGCRSAKDSSIWASYFVEGASSMRVKQLLSARVENVREDMGGNDGSRRDGPLVDVVCDSEEAGPDGRGE